MLYQHPYHHPLIPRSTALAPTPPYVGGELAALTSNTPFYRGQGIPLYEETTVCRKMNFGSANYGAAITVGLAKRAKGDSVKTLQRKLKALGMYTDDIDGDFYTNTEAALKKFQKANSLPQSGMVDAATLAKLQGKKTQAEKDAAKDAAAAGIAQGVGTLFSSFATGIGQTAGQSSGGSTVNITTHQAQGMSTGAKIGIAVAAFAAIGLLGFVALKD